MPTEKQVVAQRTTWASIGINLVLVSLQLAVGAIAHSQALIADGVHSLSDLLADGIVLLANRGSNPAPDDDHNYGHSRYETVASFFLGALLLVLGIGMLWQAGERLTQLHQSPDVHAVALGVAALAILLKEGLFRYMLREARRVRSSLLVANAWHARSDAASSLVVALGILGSMLGFKVLDPIAASIVGFMVARMGWGFAWNALQDLSDRAVDAAEADHMRSALASTPGVAQVHAFRTRKMADNVLIDAHLLVDPHISVSEGHYIAEAARLRLRDDARVTDVMIHIDPEDDEMVMPTRSGLPMRPEMLERARQLLAPVGVTVVAANLHYLEGQIDMDLFLAAERLPEAMTGNRSAWCLRLGEEAVVRGTRGNWSGDELASALGVRRLRVFLDVSDT